MKKKYLILLIIFFLIPHCGYGPIYTKSFNTNFEFNIIDLRGDASMNKIVSLQMVKYSKKSSAKKFDLKVNTNYKKLILSKNKVGEATSYNVITSVEFETINSPINQKFIFSENTNIENINNKFELKNYENTIKNNFISSKIEELILKLNSMQ